MITQEQSENFFNSQLKPVLEQVEFLRKKILEKGKRNKLFLSGFGILIFLYTYSAVQEWADTPMQKFWMSALLIILLVAVYISIRPEVFLPRNERNRIFKLYTNGVVREMVRFINNSFNFHPIYKTNIRLFERSLLFANKITAYQETYGIVGKIEDIEVKISEVEVKTSQAESKEPSSFKGWFVSFDAKLQFRDFALFCNDSDIEKWNRKEDCTHQSKDRLHTYKPSDIDEELFGRIEKIFTHYRMKIGRKMQLSLVDNKMYLAVENDQHFFQLSFRDDNNNYFGTYMDFGRMTLITNMIEELTLTLKTVPVK